jgi:hypothetical protein
MAQVQASSSDVKQQVREAAQDASPVIEKLARFGYVAKGVVYILVGIIAIIAAMGFRQQATGSRGVLATIAQAPLGRPLLIALAVGLAGYALFKLLSGLLDPEREGKDLKGIGSRIGDIVSAFIHGGLAWVAIKLAFGNGAKGDVQQSQESTATAMSLPFGPTLVMIVGGIVVACGLYQAFVGLKGGFDKKLCTEEMSEACKLWVSVLGRAGHIALGIVLGLVGAFIFNAGRNLNPRESTGVVGALESINNKPMGTWMLIAVAVGLIMYGAFMFMKARFRPIAVA